MRSLCSIMFVLLSSIALVACGDDGGSSGPDAKVFQDAPTPDAPVGLTGLGKRCVVAMQGADCPMAAPGCLSFAAGATMGICTNVCQMNTTFTTNAQSVPGPLTPDPALQNGKCTAIYSATVGTAACDTPVNITPAPPFQPNTNYTTLMVCGITCGAGNTCAGGLTCNTADMSCRP
jgi:hypothetical protein